MLVPYKQTYMESLFTQSLLIPIDGGFYDRHSHTLFQDGLMKVYLSYGVLDRVFKMELSIAFKPRFATFMHTTNLKQILTYVHCFDNNLSSFLSKSKLKNLHFLLHVKSMSVF